MRAFRPDADANIVELLLEDAVGVPQFAQFIILACHHVIQAGDHVFQKAVFFLKGIDEFEQVFVCHDGMRDCNKNLTGAGYYRGITFK